MADHVDHVDAVLAQWRAERPDLDVAPMGTFGRLGRLHGLGSVRIEAVLRQHGLGIGEFDVLAALRRAGAPFEMTPSALARLVLLTPAGMTNRIDRLEAAGLVERRADPDDRRSFKAGLTASGRRVVDAAVTDHVANEAAMLGALSPAERRRLDDLLRKLLAGLEAAG